MLSRQWQTIKENWLIVLLLVLLVLLPKPQISMPLLEQRDLAYDTVMSDGGYEKSPIYPPYPSEEFAPDVDERSITVTTSLVTEVKRGEYDKMKEQARNIFVSSDAFLLNDQENTYESNRKQYKESSFQIKVESSKYKAVIDQLKQIGEIISFTENAYDITQPKATTKTELEAEKLKLGRYKTMFEQAATVEEKLQLSDRIFEQERRIFYLEQALGSIEQQVEYSTIYFTLREKRSEYADVVFVTLGDLVSRFVTSVNTLLKYIVFFIPWIIVIGLIKALFFRKKKGRN